MVATTEDGEVVHRGVTEDGVVVHHGVEAVHHGVEVVGHLVPEVVDLGVLVPGLHQVLEEHLVARQQPEKLMNTYFTINYLFSNFIKLISK